MTVERENLVEAMAGAIACESICFEECEAVAEAALDALINALPDASDCGLITQDLVTDAEIYQQLKEMKR